MTNVELEDTLKDISHLAELVRFNSTNKQQKEFGFEYRSGMKEGKDNNIIFDNVIKFTLPDDE